MEYNRNVGASAKTNLRQKMYLGIAALGVLVFGGLNYKGCEAAIEGNENPYGIISELGYVAGQQWRRVISGGLEDKTNIVFPGQQD